MFDKCKEQRALEKTFFGACPRKALQSAALGVGLLQAPLRSGTLCWLLWQPPSTSLPEKIICGPNAFTIRSLRGGGTTTKQSFTKKNTKQFCVQIASCLAMTHVDIIHYLFALVGVEVPLFGMFRRASRTTDKVDL